MGDYFFFFVLVFFPLLIVALMLALAQYQKMKKRVRVAIDGYDNMIKDYIRLVVEETHRKGREDMGREKERREQLEYMEMLENRKAELMKQLIDLKAQVLMDAEEAERIEEEIRFDLKTLNEVCEDVRRTAEEFKNHSEDVVIDADTDPEAFTEFVSKYRAIFIRDDEEEEEMVAELYDKKDWKYKDGWYYPPGYAEDEEEEEFDSDEFFQEVYADALKHMDSVVHHPKHYNQYGEIEVVDIITEATKNMQGDKGYVFGNILKYLLRAPFKGKFEEDVAKANWYWKYYHEKYGAAKLSEIEIHGEQTKEDGKA